MSPPISNARDAEWNRLGRFLDTWFPKASHSAGLPTSQLDAAEGRLGVRLPAALREWYERFGARTGVWSLQDSWCEPSKFEIEDGTLVFCVENQGVIRWGIRVTESPDEDPPVVVSEWRGPEGWLVESDSTSAFAHQLAAMNVKWSSAIAHRADGWCDAAMIEAVERNFPRLPLREMHWPSYPTRFYGDEALIIEAHADAWLWVSALTKSAFDRVDAVVRDAGMVWGNVLTE